MINPQWLELPMSRTNFHGPKDVGATEVRLYFNVILGSLIPFWLLWQSNTALVGARGAYTASQTSLLYMKRLNKTESPIFVPLRVFFFFFFFFFFLFTKATFITKTYLHVYNFDPLKLHFYIVKLGFTGVYIIFLISAQKHRLWVLVRTASPRRF